MHYSQNSEISSEIQPKTMTLSKIKGKMALKSLKWLQMHFGKKWSKHNDPAATQSRQSN